MTEWLHFRNRFSQVQAARVGDDLVAMKRLVSTTARRRVRKYERSRKTRILEAFSTFAETSRRGTGSVIGAPEQTSYSSSHCQPSLDTSHSEPPRRAGLGLVCIFGHDGVAAQRVEARIGCKILNTMTALGMPDSEMIG